MSRQEDLVDKKSELKKQILTLKWDKKQNQIGFAKAKLLDDCTKELEKVEAELNGEAV